MKHFQTVVIILFVLFVSHTVEAQEKWSLEFRGGAEFATQELGDADLDTGLGFEGTAAYRFMPHLASYVGWGLNHFSADQSFAGTDMDFEETGYTFGMQFIHPLADSKINYLIRAGGIYNHIETENDKGDIIDDSDHGLGWQIGAGLVIPLNDRWRLMPSLRYRSLSRDIEVNNAETSVNLNHISAGVGLSWLF